MKCAFGALLALTLAFCLILSGCGDSGSGGEVDAPGPDAGDGATEPLAPSGEPVTILVAAAASLENSYVQRLIPMFEELCPWITVEGTYASSGNLQTQIEEGMDADVFMSAAMTQMNNLIEQDLVDGSSTVQLLENRIMLVVPAGVETDIERFEDIVRADTIALGDPASVPAGQYAEEALTALGLYDEVAAKSSFGADVTQVLNWVAEGSADAGIVYATDAASTDRVTVIAEAPDGSLSQRVIYPVGVVAGTANREAADLFVEFLQTDPAIAVFEEYGFSKA